MRFCQALGKFPHVTGAAGTGAMRWLRESGKATVDRAGVPRGLGSGSGGISLARSPGVLDLDPLAPRTPRLPHQRLGAPQLAASIALHVSLVVVAALDRDHDGTWHRVPPGRTDHRRTSAACRVSRARGAADRRRRGWRRQSATGADPSRAGRRLGLDDPASAKRAVANGRPGDDGFRTCRRGHSSAAIDRARGEAAGLRPVRSDWTAGRRRDVRHVDRSGVRRRRRHRNRDRYWLGTWAGTRPRIGRRNRRRRLPPWRGSIRTAPDQRGQAEVHERGAPQQDSRHGGAGSRRLRRRMHVANPCRQISGPWRSR